MNPLTPPEKRQLPAGCFAGREFVFDREGFHGHSGCGAGSSSNDPALVCKNRYPSPSLRPGPFRVRPPFPGSRRGRQSAAYGGEACRILFSSAANAVKLPRITTLAGGSLSCGSRNSFSPSPSRPVFPVASKPIASALSPARLPARSSPTLSTPTFSPALLPALLAARSATTSDSAADPAGLRPQANLHDATGARRSGGVFVSATGGEPRRDFRKGTACSRRS